MNLLHSSHAITGSCVISWFLTSTSWDDIIDHPIKSIFWPVVCGGFAGRWISDCAPDPFKPYVAGGILALTGVAFVAKKLNWIKEPVKPNRTDFLRISYTTHNVLENKGPIINIDNEFSVENITNNIFDCLDSKVIESLDSIISVLKENDHLSRLSGIFIHDAYKGLVQINGPNKESKLVLSIRV